MSTDSDSGVLPVTFFQCEIMHDDWLFTSSRISTTARAEGRRECVGGGGQGKGGPEPLPSITASNRWIILQFLFPKKHESY